jgi:hypothetical protein
VQPGQAAPVQPGNGETGKYCQQCKDWNEGVNAHFVRGKQPGKNTLGIDGCNFPVEKVSSFQLAGPRIARASLELPGVSSRNFSSRDLQKCFDRSGTDRVLSLSETSAAMVSNLWLALEDLHNVACASRESKISRVTGSLTTR